MTRQQNFTFTHDGTAREGHGLVCEGGMQALADMARARQTQAGWTSISAERIRKLETGDASNAAKADALLDKLEAPDLASYVRATNERVMAGGVADVPAYLAGAPVAMRRRVRQQERMPITLVCDVTTSAGIDAAIIQRRGVAVLALVRKLESAGYPVDLWLGFCAKEGGGARLPAAIAVKVDTKPLDLARACWGLSAAEYQREVMFQTLCGVSGQSYTGLIVWPWGGASVWLQKPDMQRACYAALLNQDPANLLVMPAVFADEAKHFNTEESTLAWVNAMYARSCALVANPEA